MINGPRTRCSVGLRFDNKATRCWLPAGHSGPHKGRDRKSNPYVTVRWFDRDARQFLTTRANEYAWTMKEIP